MITYLKNAAGVLETLPAAAPGCWINAVDPDEAEVRWLQQHVAAPADFITYPLDVDEQARSEREDEALLIVLRVPIAGSDADAVPYTTAPLGIILTRDHVVTVSRVQNGVMHGLLSGRVRGLSTVKQNRFVLHLLLVTAQKYLAYLRDLNRSVDTIEDRLQASLRNREVHELLKHQKSLVYFTTALKQNELMLRRLQRSKLFESYPEDGELLDDVMTEVQQAIEMTDISSNILSNMMDAFASIISNNLNVVMKFLASVTIVMSVPTMVASFYGMNVALPLASYPYAFAMTLGVSLVISLLVVLVFRKKDWF